MTIQVRYSHIQCSDVLKHKIMWLKIGANRNLQGLWDPPSSYHPLTGLATEGHCQLTQLLGIAFFFMFIFSKHEPSKSTNPCWLGHCNKFNFHLKKRHKSIPKNYLKYKKRDSIVVRFRVTINKSSSLHCLAWSQLRKTSPQIGKHWQVAGY